MAKSTPEWFTVLVNALTAHPETSGRKRALRSAAKDVSDLGPVRGRFILWVLREFIPPCPEVAAVAALWDRRMAEDEPSEAEWHEAAEAARLAAMAEDAGDKGMVLSEVARSAGMTTPEGQRTVLLMEPTHAPAALTVLKMVHSSARDAAHHSDTRDAAWSAALVHRADVMRGVVTSAARTGADVAFSYRAMADKLLDILKA